MKVESDTEAKEKSIVVIMDRGMNKDECRAVCTSPLIPLREKLFFRMIYETTTRPREVLEARIELWNRNTGEITFPKTKSKYNRWTKKFISGSPKTMKLTSNTNEMLRHYIGNRKKGHIFINEKTGKRLTLRHFEKEIDKWARLLNVQKLQSIKPSGKEYHLVTLMALREAGERHYDLNGGDPDVSAKASGHSKETKARYYKKVSYEEAQESYAKHHPAFVDGW
jgi:integrase